MTARSNVRRIGAHLSIAQGLITAAQNMIDMGGNTLQIFSGSPRGWERKPIENIPGEAFYAFCIQHDFGPVYIHALYLVNLASERQDLIDHSIQSLMYDLKFSERIHAHGVIVHVGSHLGKGFSIVKPDIIKRIQNILSQSLKTSKLLIENSAGQKGKIASDFSEIRELFNALPKEVSAERLGWCLDTCHAFANGYDLQSLEKEITTYHLWDTLAVIHLNDSKDPFGSGRDRHENIGEGTIGKETMHGFLHNPRFSQVPLILEVPGFDKKGPDEKNIDIVKSLLE